MHCVQKVCPQGVESGELTTLRHMGHSKQVSNVVFVCVVTVLATDAFEVENFPLDAEATGEVGVAARAMNLEIKGIYPGL